MGRDRPGRFSPAWAGNGHRFSRDEWWFAVQPRVGGERVSHAAIARTPLGRYGVRDVGDGRAHHASCAIWSAPGRTGANFLCHRRYEPNPRRSARPDGPTRAWRMPTNAAPCRPEYRRHVCAKNWHGLDAITCWRIRRSRDQSDRQYARRIKTGHSQPCPAATQSRIRKRKRSRRRLVAPTSEVAESAAVVLHCRAGHTELRGEVFGRGACCDLLNELATSFGRQAVTRTRPRG